MDYMSYVETKEAFEKELLSMGKSVSHPVVSIHSDRQKVDIEVFLYNTVYKLLNIVQDL